MIGEDKTFRMLRSVARSGAEGKKASESPAHGSPKSVTTNDLTSLVPAKAGELLGGFLLSAAAGLHTTPRVHGQLWRIRFIESTGESRRTSPSEPNGGSHGRTGSGPQHRAPGCQACVPLVKYLLPYYILLRPDPRAPSCVVTPKRSILLQPRQFPNLFRTAHPKKFLRAIASVQHQSHSTHVPYSSLDSFLPRLRKLHNA